MVILVPDSAPRCHKTQDDSIIRRMNLMPKKKNYWNIKFFIVTLTQFMCTYIIEIRFSVQPIHNILCAKLYMRKIRN